MKNKKPKTKAKPKIENIVSSITLYREIDLNKLSKRIKEIENPKQFPGVIYRIEKPKVAMLIFKTGKVICSGARSKKDVEGALKILLKTLMKAGFKVSKKPTVEIQNIVASSSLNFKVNLDVLATECVNTEYEPEQFPGLVFRLEEPKTVMLIFRSGRIIITGAKSARDTVLAAERTREMVLEYDAII